MVSKDLSFRSYSDLQGLNNLKLEAGRDRNNPETLKAVAGQFESLFLNMLLKNMRQANETFSKDSYFNSNQTKFYQGMLDQQLSLSLSENGGIGLSEVMVRQLSPKSAQQTPSKDQAAADLISQSLGAQGLSEQEQRKLVDRALEQSARQAVESQSSAEVAAEHQEPVLPELKPGEFADAIRAVEERIHELEQGIEESSAVSGQSASVRSLLDQAAEMATLAAANPNFNSDDLFAPGARSVADTRNTLSIEEMASASLGQPGDLFAGLGVETLPERFESPEDFVQGLYPIAQRVAQEMGIDPGVLLAQSALETGWGKHLPTHSDGSSSFNLFGIKADKRWSGDSTMVDTLEFRNGVAAREKAAFRAYGSYEQSMRDYVDFIRSNPRYQPALEQVGDGPAYLEQLQLAGYATDPMYARKITGILNGDVLQGAIAGLNTDRSEG